MEDQSGNSEWTVFVRILETNLMEILSVVLHIVLNLKIMRVFIKVSCKTQTLAFFKLVIYVLINLSLQQRVIFILVKC